VSEEKENIEQHQSEQPKNNQAGVDSSNAADLQLTNDEQKPKKMDTHAHHLHKAPGEKAWHYFFEFLMLFIAVSLGFFAENKREEYVEKTKAKEYAKSLYDDLKVDTMVVQRTLKIKTFQGNKLDSLLIITGLEDLSKHRDQLLYYLLFIYPNDVFMTQDVTFLQLRNSGNFRYIENLTLYKKIANYYKTYENYRNTDETLFSYIDLSEIESKLFYPTDIFKCTNPKKVGIYSIEKPKFKIYPRKIDNEAITMLQIRAVKEITRNGVIKFWLSELYLNATECLKELNNEYHFE
jgi:hypothetical protein